MSLRKARLEIMQELQTIADIRYAPDSPTDDVSFPVAIGYMDNGKYDMHTVRGQLRGLHNITIDLHVIKEPDLERGYDELEPFCDLVVEHLFTKMLSKEWSTIQAWDIIEYDAMPARYNNVKTLMIRFFVRNVKVFTNL